MAVGAVLCLFPGRSNHLWQNPFVWILVFHFSSTSLRPCPPNWQRRFCARQVCHATEALNCTLVLSKQNDETALSSAPERNKPATDLQLPVFTSVYSFDPWWRMTGSAPDPQPGPVCDCYCIFMFSTLAATIDRSIVTFSVDLRGRQLSWSAIDREQAS